MLKIRRSQDRLIFNVGIHILIRRHLYIETGPWRFNTLRPRQNGLHFADGIFKHIILNANGSVSIKISPKFVPKDPINNIRHWFRYWLGVDQARSNYPNQWCIDFRHIYVLQDLNELRQKFKIHIVSNWIYNINTHVKWIYFLSKKYIPLQSVKICHWTKIQHIPFNF